MMSVALILIGKSRREEGLGENIISSVLGMLSLRWLGDIQFKISTGSGKCKTRDQTEVRAGQKAENH